jgi:hypothetical protein
MRRTLDRIRLGAAAMAVCFSFVAWAIKDSQKLTKKPKEAA